MPSDKDTPREYHIERDDRPDSLRGALKRDDGQHGAPGSLRSAGEVDEQTRENTDR